MQRNIKMTTPKFAMCDTKKENGLYISFEKKVVYDDHFEPDHLFQDDAYKEEDQKRLDAFKEGEWLAIGIRAVAIVSHVSNGASFNFTIESAGLWGIESDSDEKYIEETYQDQVDSLKATITALKEPIYVS